MAIKKAGPESWLAKVRTGVASTAQTLKPKGNPAGIAISSCGDSNSSLYGLLWSFGGSVTAKDGKVQLRGRVRHHYQSDAAEWAVSHVDGLLAMENLIAISSEPIPSDIADRINKAFQRSAIIDDSKIKVTNDGHTVYLDGLVSSDAARREADDTTWAAPGVESVVSNLVIEP